MRGIAALLLLSLGTACVPDEFSYGTAGAGGAGECDDDSCAGAAPVCPDRWNGALDAWQGAALILDEQRARVLTTGATAADGRDATAAVAAVERCDGGLSGLVPVAAATTPSTATGVAALGDAIYVSVAEQPEGAAPAAALAVLAASDLTARQRVPIATSDGASLVSIAASAGHVWAVGHSGSGAASAPLAVKLAPDGAACTFSFAVAPGVAAAVAISGESVFVAGELGGAAVLWRFDDSACQPPACACAPAVVSPPFAVPEATAAFATDVLTSGGDVFVAGAAERADGSSFGFVLAADVTTLAPEAMELFASSAGADAVLALASDGEGVYFAGTRHGSGAPGDAAVAVFGELTLPLGAGASWVAEAPGASAVTALGADPGGEGTLYLGMVGGGGVRRCDKLGVCPD